MSGCFPKLWPPPRIVVVSSLRAAWIIVVLWYEVYTFDHVLQACQWPDIYQVKSQYPNVSS
jgi:hypothetical protein